jgi:hypothetical protein
MIAKEPLSTRQFVIITLVLSLFSFIPVINLFSGILLIVTFIAWILSDLQGFLSVLWRTLLGAGIVSSALILADALIWDPYKYSGDVNQYGPNFLIAGTIGFALSAIGIVRSIIKARRRQEWLME